MAESMGSDVLGQVLQSIQILSEQVKGLGDRMDRMDKQDSWQTTGRELRAELRSDLHAVRMELQLGLHQVHARIDRTNDALFLRGLGLYRTVG